MGEGTVTKGSSVVDKRWRLSSCVWRPRISRSLSFRVISSPTEQTRTGVYRNYWSVLLVVALGWNDDFLKTNLLPLDVEMIKSIPVSCYSAEDRMIWHYDEKGCYSVKSGYHIAMQTKHLPSSLKGSADKQWWNFLWHSKIPNKVKIFVCRVLHDILPIWKNMFKRGVGENESCRRCTNGKESLFPALVYCNAAIRIWSKSVFWDRLNSFRGDRLEYLLLALRQVETKG